MTAEEHKRFLEADFDDVSLDKLVDISKIRIDRNRNTNTKSSIN